MMRWIVAVTALSLPGAVQAQAYQCSAPMRIERPHADLPSADQPRRPLAIGGYTLAITWAPEYCRTHAGDAGAQFQCGGSGRFGFTLHGLWPDGVGATWPQYCRPTGLLPASLLRANLCATPSAQLQQHEWAKHGTCMTTRPASYFARSTGLYRRLRYPDMARLSRADLTAGGLARAMAAVNPDLGADMMRITATRQGWLDEIWICLDKRFAYQRCPAHQGGLSEGAAVRIWRGER